MAEYVASWLRFFSGLNLQMRSTRRAPRLGPICECSCIKSSIKNAFRGEVCSISYDEWLTRKGCIKRGVSLFQEETNGNAGQPTRTALELKAGIDLRSLVARSWSSMSENKPVRRTTNFYFCRASRWRHWRKRDRTTASNRAQSTSYGTRTSDTFREKHNLEVTRLPRQVGGNDWSQEIVSSCSGAERMESSRLVAEGRLRIFRLNSWLGIDLPLETSTVSAWNQKQLRPWELRPFATRVTWTFTCDLYTRMAWKVLHATKRNRSPDWLRDESKAQKQSSHVEPSAFKKYLKE